MRIPILVATLSLCLAPVKAQEAPPAVPPTILHHDLEVQLDPETGGLVASDTLTVARNGGGILRFRLRSGLVISGLTVDGRAQESIARSPGPHGLVDTVQVPIHAGGSDARVAMDYAGIIREEVRKSETTSFVVGDHSRGTIGPKGVYLSGATGWTADDGGLATYAVTATVPDGWSVCTQGGVPTEEGTKAGTRFTYPAGIPVDSLWLQAGKWRVARRTIGGVSIGTYLSESNAGVSKVMIDSIGEYLELYEKVLGKYPHAKFDIVENFFTSGYGMPTATLLGPMVIARIGMVSQRGGKVPPGYLDHELVHCWWGNGVFVDYQTGNWCEALTTYCSNYLRKEWESEEEATKHRATTRARFATRVSPEQDYPLRRFTGKQEDFENDIGYGKGSMLFHTVRRAIGDEAFFGSLRDVVKDFTGKRASWADLQAAFEKRGGRRLGPVFRAFLDNVGAPLVSVENVTVASTETGWTVSGELTQQDEPWPLAVPLALETLTGTETQTIDLTGQRTAFSLHSTSLPTRVLMDPDSQVFRGFAEGEIPPTLNRFMEDGDHRMLAFSTEETHTAPYQGLLARMPKPIKRWGTSGTGIPINTNRSLFAVGHPDENPGTEVALDMDGCPISLRGDTLVAGGRRFEGDDIAVLASFPHAGDARRTVTVYFGMSPAALRGASRIFYYGAEGVVVFKGGRPIHRISAEGDDSSRVALSEALFSGGDDVRTVKLVSRLVQSDLDGRLAGSKGGIATRKLLVETLQNDGLKVVRQPFSFDVLDWDGSACVGGIIDDTTATPFCFSGVSLDWIDVPAHAPISVDDETKPEDLLSSIEDCIEKGAKAVLVTGPVTAPEAVAEYLVHPSRLTDEEMKRISDGNRVRHVAGLRARLLQPTTKITVPVVYFGSPPERSARPKAVRVQATTTTIQSENLFAVIAGEKQHGGPAVLLSAHFDGLGPGFQGADDNASGVAALREAARHVMARRADLGAPVVIGLFGAEEWGLQGSRFFATHQASDLLPPIGACLNLDTVGDRAKGDVHVIGESVYKSLGGMVKRSLLGAGLKPGSDIDRFAFPHGSDHWPLHVAGIPSLDLFSGNYRRMNSKADTLDLVDAAKVSRIARAAAAFALGLSREGLPE